MISGSHFSVGGSALSGRRVVTLGDGPSLAGPQGLTLPDGSKEVLTATTAMSAPQMALFVGAIKLGGALVQGSGDKSKEIIGQLTTYVIQNVEPEKSQTVLQGMTNRSSALYAASLKDLTGKVFGMSTAGTASYKIIAQEMSKAGVDPYEQERVAQAVFNRFHSPKGLQYKKSADRRLEQGMYKGWLVKGPVDTGGIVETAKENTAWLIGGAAVLALFLFMGGKKKSGNGNNKGS